MFFSIVGRILIFVERNKRDSKRMFIGSIQWISMYCNGSLFFSLFLSFIPWTWKYEMLAHSGFLYVIFNSFLSCVWCSLSATIANGDYLFTIVAVFTSLLLIHVHLPSAVSHSHLQRNVNDILIYVELCALCAILSRHWLRICDSKEISKIVMKYFCLLVQSLQFCIRFFPKNLIFSGMFLL